MMVMVTLKIVKDLSKVDQTEIMYSCCSLLLMFEEFKGLGWNDVAVVACCTCFW
jgi:hypothetical protein